jgi:hypothetical protein
MTTVKLAFAIGLVALFVSGTFYAQEHGAGQHNKADVSAAPEIFCNHLARLIHES